MSKNDLNAEIAADKRADRNSLILVVLFTALSWVVLSMAMHINNVRNGAELGMMDPWLTELTSHAAIIIAVFFIPMLLSRFPLNMENWKRKLPIYLAFFFVFSSLHIVLMVVFRKVSFPVLVGRGWHESLLDTKLWLYELPKDFYTYVLILSIFIAGRHMEQLRLENANIRKEAKDTGRLRLKSGGREIFVQAEEIVRAESASNYLEIETDNSKHLVRMTLSALEKLIAEAGDTHVRIHRSHLVKKAAVRELVPSGDGSAKITLKHGEVLPVGRKYRGTLSLQT